MLKKILLLASIFVGISLQVNAFEDCVIMSDSKLVDIRIENNKIIDVYPLVTVMNEKNTLIVHPLAVGTTCFTVLKDYKEKVLFHVDVTEEGTTIPHVEGFKIFTLDEPPLEENFELDLPPGLISPSKMGGAN